MKDTSHPPVGLACERIFAAVDSYVMAAYTLGGVVGPWLMGDGYDRGGSSGFMRCSYLLTAVGASGLMLKLGSYTWARFADWAAVESLGSSRGGVER